MALNPIRDGLLEERPRPILRLLRLALIVALTSAIGSLAVALMVLMTAN